AAPAGNAFADLPIADVVVPPVATAPTAELQVAAAEPVARVWSEPAVAADAGSPFDSAANSTPNAAAVVEPPAPQAVASAGSPNDPFFSGEPSGWVVVEANGPNRPAAPVPSPFAEPIGESPAAAPVQNNKNSPVETTPAGPPVAPYVIVGPGTRRLRPPTEQAENVTDAPAAAVEPATVAGSDGPSAPDTGVVPVAAVREAVPRVSVVGPPTGAVTASAAVPDSKGRLLAAQTRAADRLIKSGEFVAAHEILTRVYWTAPDERASLWRPIEQTAAVVHFTAGAPTSGGLAATLDVGLQTLTVHSGPNRSYVRAYPCALGPDAAGLSGTYRVGMAEEPDAAFGPFRLPLVEPAGVWGKSSRVAIHGTDDPASVGGSAGRGCVVLTNSDIVDLVSLLPNGAAVTVVP
ncbi:MAG: L,D-transpeptidase family protein, partial [Planctomycetota bacterium]